MIRSWIHNGITRILKKTGSETVFNKSLFLVDGDPGEPNGASKTEEQGADGREQTATAASREFGKVGQHYFFSPLIFCNCKTIKLSFNSKLKVCQMKVLIVTEVQ